MRPHVDGQVAFSVAVEMAAAAAVEAAAGENQSVSGASLGSVHRICIPGRTFL